MDLGDRALLPSYTGAALNLATDLKPVAASSTVTTTNDGLAAVTLSAADAETPSSSLTYTITSLPQGALFRADGTAVAGGRHVHRRPDDADVLTGDNADNVLVGGAGNDVLAGGSGRNILIGGAGADAIVGGVADDVLIGGPTLYDGNFTALDSILAEWASVDTYANRVNFIKVGGGLNKTNKLAWLSTVTDDGSADSMTGAAGADRFFTGPATRPTCRPANRSIERDVRRSDRVCDGRNPEFPLVARSVPYPLPRKAVVVTAIHRILYHHRSGSDEEKSQGAVGGIGAGVEGGAAHRIVECLSFERAKGEAGLADDQVRNRPHGATTKPCRSWPRDS